MILEYMGDWVFWYGAGFGLLVAMLLVRIAFWVDNWRTDRAFREYEARLATE